MAIPPVAVDKAVYDDRVFKFSFANFDEIVAGDTVASGTVTCPDAALVIGTPTPASPASALQAEISGGVAGTVYKVTVKVTLTSGSKLEGFANFSVSAPSGF